MKTADFIFMINYLQSACKEQIFFADFDCADLYNKNKTETWSVLSVYGLAAQRFKPLMILIRYGNPIIPMSSTLWD